MRVWGYSISMENMQQRKEAGNCNEVSIEQTSPKADEIDRAER